MHRGLISHKGFNTATFLGQLRIFDPFWGTLGVKKVKGLLSKGNHPRNFKFARNNKFSAEI